MGGRRAAAAAALLLIKKCFSGHATRLPSYPRSNWGWHGGGERGCHIPGLFPSPSGPPRGPQAQRGVLTCPALLHRLVGRLLTPRNGRGAQGTVGAPRSWKKGKPFGYSSNRCRLPPKPPPGTRAEPRLHQRPPRRAGCQQVLGRRRPRRRRQLIPRDIRISSSPTLSPPAPSPAWQNCHCHCERGFPSTG